MSLYEKHAEVQAAQLMACLEEQSDDEEEEEDPTIKSSSRSCKNGSKPRRTVDCQAKGQENRSRK